MVTPKPLRLRYPDVYLTPPWPTLLRPRPDGIPRFKATTTSALFAAAGYELPASLEPWWAYISKRYSEGPFLRLIFVSPLGLVVQRLSAAAYASIIDQPPDTGREYPGVQVPIVGLQPPTLCKDGG